MKSKPEEDTTPHIHTALKAVLEDIHAIPKNQTNTHFHYKFRGIDQVMATFSTLYRKHSVVVRKKDLQIYPEVGGVYVKCTYVFHSLLDGSEIECDGWGQGKDSQDKAAGKASSNAYKYLHLETFCIPTEEQKDSDQDDRGEEGGGTTGKSSQTGRTNSRGDVEHATGGRMETGSRRPITPDQIKLVHVLKGKLEATDEAYRSGLQRHYKVSTSKQLTETQASDLIDRMQKRLHQKVENESLVSDVRQMDNWQPGSETESESESDVQPKAQVDPVREEPKKTPKTRLKWMRDDTKMLARSKVMLGHQDEITNLCGGDMEEIDRMLTDELNELRDELTKLGT